MSVLKLNMEELTSFDVLSSNSLGNIAMAILLGVAALYGIGEEPINALIAAALPVYRLFVEIVKGTRKARYWGNAISYFLGAIVLISPELAGIVDALQPIASAIIGGNIDALWVLLIPLVNQIIVYIQTRRSNQESAKNPAPQS